jgi:hypothetical protein
MTKKKLKKRGPREVKFDLEKVKQLAGQGLTKTEIALAMGHSTSCFFKQKAIDSKIDDAIAEGRASFKVFLSSTLIDQAKRGNVTAAIWLDKTRCGTKEDGPENGEQTATPVKITREVIDGRKVSGEQTPG